MAIQVNRDGSAVTNPDWSMQAVKTMTFAGATTNDPGDYDGTGNPATLFTVTGPVLMRIFGWCTSSLSRASLSPSASTSPSSSASSSVSRSTSPSDSASPSASASGSPSGSRSPSASASGSPSSSVSPSSSASSSPSASISPSASVSLSVSPSSSPSSGSLATIAVGTALNTTALIAATPAVDIDVNEIWHDATPDSSVEAVTVTAQKIVTQDVIQTVGVANVNSGVIKYVCMWYPLTPDSNVTAA